MRDTTLGGSARSFPTTLWSDVRQADPIALDRLIRRYWRPIYAYVRVAWHKSVEDAKDLTQSFFAHVLEKGYLARLTPERGRFRGYLRTALRHFLVDLKRRDQARPSLVPLEIEPAGEGEDPFDREWFQSILDEAVEELRTDPHFDVFRLYCLEDQGATYRDVAEKLGMTEAEVRHRLADCRASLRRILRERIREYALSEVEVEAELGELLGR